MPKTKVKTVYEETTADEVTRDLTTVLIDLRIKTQKFRDVVGRGIGAREIAIAITKVEEAEMWLTRATTELIIAKENTKK